MATIRGLTLRDVKSVRAFAYFCRRKYPDNIHTLNLNIKTMNNDRLTLALRNTEMADATKVFIAETKKHENDAAVTGLVNQIEELCETLIDVNSIILFDHQVKENTTQLNAGFTAIRELIDGFAKSPKQELRAAAAKAKTVTDSHKNFLRLSRSEKTADALALIQDFSVDEMKETVTVIPTLAECLEDFRNSAESLSRKRLDEMTEKNRSKSVKPSVTARQIADIINNKIMVLVAANAINDPGRYQAELDALKGIIGQYNAIARSRRPQKATK